MFECKVVESDADWDLLNQELAIAEWCPKQRKTLKKKEKEPFLYVTSRETERLLDVWYPAVTQHVSHWKDQVQVAHWANTNLLNAWTVNVLLINECPAYYLVLNLTDPKRPEMKGMWRSLYGTLKSLDSKTPVPRGQSFDLLKWALRDVRDDMLIHVNARIGLENMLSKHNVKLCYVEKRIPKSQGASVFAHFKKSEINTSRLC